MAKHKNTKQQIKNIEKEWDAYSKKHKLTQSYAEIDELMGHGCSFINAYGEEQIISNNEDQTVYILGHLMEFTAGEDGGMTITPPYSFEF